MNAIIYKTLSTMNLEAAVLERFTSVLAAIATMDQDRIEYAAIPTRVSELSVTEAIAFEKTIAAKNKSNTLFFKGTVSDEELLQRQNLIADEIERAVTDYQTAKSATLAARERQQSLYEAIHNPAPLPLCTAETISIIRDIERLIHDQRQNAANARETIVTRHREETERFTQSEARRIANLAAQALGEKIESSDYAPPPDNPAPLLAEIDRRLSDLDCAVSDVHVIACRIIAETIDVDVARSLQRYDKAALSLIEAAASLHALGSIASEHWQQSTISRDMSWINSLEAIKIPDIRNHRPFDQTPMFQQSRAKQEERLRSSGMLP